MDNMTLKKMLIETEPDFSAKIIDGFIVADIDEEALGILKRKWSQKSNREDFLQFSTEKVLQATGLMSDKGLNYACLILLGEKEKIDEYLPGSEIIFEWRQDNNKISYDYRKNWREPFFKIYEEIWAAINARNLRMPFQEGFVQREIYAFSEKPIREAILNAVAHRDYSINKQSIFMKASPEEFVIESPGGLLPGITPENIIYKSAWRNRTIAEVFEKAGLVERSGQGMDDIFSSSIKEGKGLPDLTESNPFSVKLKMPAKVKDKNFIIFLEKVANEKQISLSIEEICELEQIREHQKTNKIEHKEKFMKNGIIEKIGKARGTKYILSHTYYKHEGKVGVYTRLSGVSREKQKELIIMHIEKNGKGFLSEFIDIFPELKIKDINNLLQELRRSGIVHFIGPKRSGYWGIINK